MVMDGQDTYVSVLTLVFMYTIIRNTKNPLIFNKV